MWYLYYVVSVSVNVNYFAPFYYYKLAHTRTTHIAYTERKRRNVLQYVKLKDI